MDKLHAYVFVHRHLSGIQKAVQASHCVANLVVQNTITTKKWTLEDQTLVLLDGGNTRKLGEIAELLQTSFKGSAFPFALFQEDYNTMGGIYTACGIILPKYLLWAADNYKNLDNSLAKLTLKTELATPSYKLDQAKINHIIDALYMINKSETLKIV